MKKTITLPTWLVLAVCIGMVFSAISTARAAEPDRTVCAVGPTLTQPINPACLPVDRPRFRLR